MITKERLHELFFYEDGHLIRKIGAANHVAGERTGHVYRVYSVMGVDGRQYRTHRMIWLYFHGNLPKVVDHIDRNPTNNKIENLRAATVAQNSRNSKGSKGVDLWKGKWRARIARNKSQYHLGYFETEREARVAYNEAAIALHGEFACLNVL